MTQTLKPDIVIQSRPWTFRSKQPFAKFFKIVSLKNFAILTRKQLCWGLFLIKLHAFRPVTFLKRDSNTCVSSGFCEVFKNTFFIEHHQWLLLTVLLQYSKVSWGVYALISRFHVLSILIKNLQKRWIIYSLLSRDKIFFPHLSWLITCFRFQNVFEKH